MRKRLLLFFCIASLPFLLVVIVNEFLCADFEKHNKASVTCNRICHDVGCIHWGENYKANPSKIKLFHKDVFDFYVRSLKQNALGMNYRFINLLVFILIYPILGSALLWHLIKRLA